ncbi:hypothetical protein POV27_16795 [Aureisphaera galaxeae]|uniref:hypothetical protein n=1 Tax=Aureisphaera galaxeae TaxID=1538023 RepID=UPI002350EA58|nr:hypothetical protein [Aureisphaera galaxeae]MDC8005719.1 hypothetical protein [Aureisphaera galaxeae]
MKSQLRYIIMFTFLAVFSFLQMDAQVAIGTNTLEDGAVFQVESSDKGVLIPRVTLTGRNDVSTITPSAVEGLWVYNTATAGTGNNRVTDGFYFWDGSEWIRVYNQGYSEQFFQTVGVKAANQSSSYTLPGLDQSITPPFSGTYQIIVVCYYAAGLQNTAPDPGVGSASVWLEIDATKVAETWLTSTSKQIGTGASVFHALGQSSVIIHNVDLQGGTSYNIRVRAREWDEDNTYNTFLSGTYGNGYGVWGIDTSYYNGNSGGDPNCQDNYMTITLLRQF